MEEVTITQNQMPESLNDTSNRGIPSSSYCDCVRCWGNDPEYVAPEHGDPYTDIYEICPDCNQPWNSAKINPEFRHNTVRGAQLVIEAYKRKVDSVQQVKRENSLENAIAEIVHKTLGLRIEKITQDIADLTVKTDSLDHRFVALKDDVDIEISHAKFDAADHYSDIWYHLEDYVNDAAEEATADNEFEINELKEQMSNLNTDDMTYTEVIARLEDLESSCDTVDEKIDSLIDDLRNVG